VKNIKKEAYHLMYLALGTVQTNVRGFSGYQAPIKANEMADYAICGDWE
jgi:hypothetical protein